MATVPLGPLQRLALLIGAILLIPAAAGAEDRVVRVESGELVGSVSEGVARFLAVPYAAPPVGERRWAAPESPPHWPGRREAKGYGAGCMQRITPDGFGPWTREYVAPPPVSEDCLTLNVWAPAMRHDQPRPVMVWIHGGAFVSGSNAVPIYDGSELAKQGIIVVSINYRLGVFGFAAFQELKSDPGGGANFGLQDILAALRWTQRNIGAFGGDPEKVTIAGQSAGAMVVHTLLVSPRSDGLFARAIAQSGIIEARLPDRAEAERRGVDLLARAKLSGVAALRRLPADQVLALLDGAPLAGTAGAGGLPLLGPIIDGEILTGALEALEAAGRARPVPVLAGLNADEGVLRPDYFKTSAASLRARAARAVGHEQSERLLRLTPLDDDASVAAANRRFTRLYGLASLLDWARAHRGPVFAYYYTHPEPGPGSDTFGAFHSSEIPYVFNMLTASSTRPFTDQDRAIAKIMSHFWANFVKFGEPSGPDLPPWPVFDGTSRGVMELGANFGLYQSDQEELLLLLKHLPARSIFGIDIAAGAPN